MNLTVEWVKNDRELQPAPFLGNTPGIPVIRVATLRRWLEHERKMSVFNEERGYVQIDDLLAQLPEEGV